MEIYERISIVRKNMKLTQDEFGKKLGVSRDVINNIEHNRLSRPEQKEPIYRLICQEFDVNETWLRTGEGEMFQDFSPEDEVAVVISNVLEDVGCKNSVYTLVKELLLKYEGLDQNSKKVIDKYVDDVLKGYIENRGEQ